MRFTEYLIEEEKLKVGDNVIYHDYGGPNLVSNGHTSLHKKTGTIKEIILDGDLAKVKFENRKNRSTVSMRLLTKL